MKVLSLFILIFIASCTVKKNVAVKDVELQSGGAALAFEQGISARGLNKHLAIIASDEYEGRETARPGQKKAAKYIENHFKAIGLAPGNKGSYQQSFPVLAKNSKNIEFSVDGKEQLLLTDYFYMGYLTDTILTDKSVAFVRYGIDDEKYSDYDKIDVKGKVVLAYLALPENQELKLSWNGWRSRVDAATKNGAIGIVFILDAYDSQIERIKPYIDNPNLEMHYQGNPKKGTIPSLFIKEEKAKLLFGGDFQSEKIEPTVSIEVDIQEMLTSENVLGYLEGSDLKDELVVITAHYDHLGYDQGEVCNGADDDGTGTVSVLELAEAFCEAKAKGNGPRRSILFMTVSGEEKGLWGSRHYTDNPVYPLESTVVDLNIDMVGRRDDEHDYDNYIYLIGADRISRDLHIISEKVNEKFVKFDLDYTYNLPDDPNRFYDRSDHYNFAKNDIPVIFYFSGLHKDYHKPTDDVELIDFNKLEKTARLVFHTAWEIANRTEGLRKNGTDYD